jgi:transposase
VSLYPLRHWTDTKICCHILTCVIALTYLRLLEIRLHRAGLSIPASTAMDNMRRIDVCLFWKASKRSAERIIEETTQILAQIFAAFGYKITGGVLQKLDV